MSTRLELESIARQWISLWRTPVDWALFDRLHAEAFEDCSPAGRPATKQGFAQGLAEFAEAFPDLQARVEGLAVDETASLVAVRWAAAGYQPGPVPGNRPNQPHDNHHRHRDHRNPGRAHHPPLGGMGYIGLPAGWIVAIATRRPCPGKMIGVPGVKESPLMSTGSIR